MRQKVYYCIFFIILISVLVGCKLKEEKTSLTILAAASLTEVCTELEKSFENKYPKINLEFSFAGTGTLVSQVKEGIDADVFVSANESSIQDLIKNDFIQIGYDKVFAHNETILMVYKDSGYNIQSIEDILQEGVKVVIAEPSQPIGKYTEELIENIDEQELFKDQFAESFYKQVVSKESSVKAVAVKVEMGEADVGIVYATDLTSINQEMVYSVKIPESCNPTATYKLATLKNSENQVMANQFVDYVLSSEGQRYLTKHGFILPE